MNLRIALLPSALLAASAAAQTTAGLMTTGGDFGFFNLEFSPGEAVKNLPYSASATTEFTQQLPDGNRIQRRKTGMVYRDSEGRTRRDQTIGPIGALPSRETRQVIIITDPIAGVNYTLDPEKKTALKFPLPKAGMGGVPGGAGVATRRLEIRQEAGRSTGTAGQVFLYRKIEHTGDGPMPQSTHLGSRTFDAVQAEGTRSVMTIPAGQVGNEKPIEVVDERWYSSQLQAVVMTKHSDPRMGDTVYQMSGITLAEPDHSLFEVPADYTIVTPKETTTRIELKND